MVELFKEEELGTLSKKIIKYSIISGVVLLISIIVCAVLCIFVDDNNATAMEIVVIVLCSLGGCVSLYILFNTILPLSRRKTYVRRVLTGQRKTLRGTPVATGKIITVSKGATVCEVEFVLSDGKSVTLLWDCSQDCSEVLGKEIEISVVQDRVVAYGVEK